MKIYTKTGDKGKCSLVDGGRVYKDDIRVECYGTVDELNAHIGVVISQLDSWHSGVQTWLEAIQVDLFVLGTNLATEELNPTHRRLSVLNVAALENMIDFCDSTNSPLTNFILPSGTSSSTALHVARTVCRRAERLAVRLSKEDEVEPINLIYLNRLSDLFFSLARYVITTGFGEEVSVDYAKGTKSLQLSPVKKEFNTTSVKMSSVKDESE